MVYPFMIILYYKRYAFMMHVPENNSNEKYKKNYQSHLVHVVSGINSGALW